MNRSATNSSRTSFYKLEVYCRSPRVLRTKYELIAFFSYVKAFLQISKFFTYCQIYILK